MRRRISILRVFAFEILHFAVINQRFVSVCGITFGMKASAQDCAHTERQVRHRRISCNTNTLLIPIRSLISESIVYLCYMLNAAALALQCAQCQADANAVPHTYTQVNAYKRSVRPRVEYSRARVSNTYTRKGLWRVVVVVCEKINCSFFPC